MTSTRPRRRPVDLTAEELDRMTPAEQARHWRRRARFFEEQRKSDLNARRTRGRGEASADARAAAAPVTVDDALEAARAEGHAAGRAEALTEVRADLVTARFWIESAGRIPPAAMSTLLPTIDVDRFITDDGDVDRERIRHFVDTFAPSTHRAHRAHRHGGAR
jgi:hypothetical protein